jgi:hypothetical protein
MIIAFVNRRSRAQREQDVPVNRLGLRDDQRAHFYDSCIRLYFSIDKPRGREFVQRATELEDPKVDDLAALLEEMVGR